ncbi:hypothetical protein BG004_003936 [Podila humilis]|nr:hypothetical protein BG004_003936 [Podila humilis]
MPLRSLRIKNSRVSLRWLSLTLERCPRLETLELMTNKISNNFFWTTNMSTINFISFALGQRISSSTASHTSNSPSTILPSLRRVHFSRKGATLEELTNDTAQSLLESIRTSVIPEWSFCYYDALSKANWLELALVPETNDIDNTIITHLEFYIPPPDKEGKLKLFKDNWAEKGEGFDLNRVLGRLPALQVLKAQGIICNLGDLNPFPIDVESGLWQESQEQLQQQQQQRTFNEEDEEGDGNRNEDHSQPEHGNDNKKVDMDDAVGHSFHGDGNNSDIIETERDLRKPVFSEPRRLWACRDLHTLEIHFYKSSQKKQQKKLEERDMRIMFGYLSKMCPKLRNLHIELDDTTPLNLTSGMCLLSRLQFLKKAVIQVYKKPGGYFWGGRGWADLSWMKRQGPTISNVDKMISYLGGQEWWERKMLVEQVLIQGRKAFVKEFGLGNEHEGMCKLGTLMDVWDCLRDLDTIASSDESWEPPAVLVPGLRS